MVNKKPKYWMGEPPQRSNAWCSNPPPTPVPHNVWTCPLQASCDYSIHLTSPQNVISLLYFCNLNFLKYFA